MNRAFHIRPAGFSLAAALIFFALLEAGLRLAGFEYHAGPVYMRFGYPDKQTITRTFRPDRFLFWRLVPGSLYLPDRILINSRGFRGPEFPQEKEKNTTRIISVGDSCTFLGEISWPERLENRLEAAHPGDRFEAVNLAVPGYSSLQGLRLLEKTGIHLKPDVVTIYFGWNDQWPHKGVKDRNQKIPEGPQAAISAALGRLRIYQALRRLVDAVRPGKTGEPRVPIPEFKDNLRRMIEISRKCGAEPLLLTAPTAARNGAELAPYLLAEGIIDDADEALATHREYNRAVREVAAETGAPLADAARAFEMNPVPAYFWKDNIHLSETGLQWIAELAEEEIKLDKNPRKVVE